LLCYENYILLISFNLLCYLSTILLSKSNVDIGIIVLPINDALFAFKLGNKSLSDNLTCDLALSFYI